MMIDVQCAKCRRRFGWSGTFANRPACPGCGHRPPQVELDASDAKMRAHDERLRTYPGRAAADTRRQQRVDAGLTLRQAAKLLGISPSELSATEQDTEPSAELCAKMVWVYGLAPTPEAG